MAKQEKKKDVMQKMAPNVLYKPFILLHYTDIPPVCSTSKFLMENICNNEEFWYEKTIHDFGPMKEKKKKAKSWKEYYKKTIIKNEKKLFPALENAKLEHIHSLCKTQPIINTIICNNEKFWKSRVIKHFGESGEKPEDDNWEKYYTTLYHDSKPVIVMGSNEYGQFGIPEDDIPGEKFREDVEGILPYFTGLRAKQAVCYDDSTFIVDVYNNVLVAGENQSGQLGLGDTKSRKLLTKIPGFKAKKVAAGHGFTLFIGMDDTLWGCGTNVDGQLGSVKSQTVLKPIQMSNMKFSFIASGYSHGAALDNKNNVYTFGKNDKYQLGIKIKNKGNTLYKTNIVGKHLGCGDNHTIVITEDNSVIGFGSNSDGQLSLENFGSYLPTVLEAYELPAFNTFCGNDKTLIISQDNEVLVSGNNSGNSLGLGFYYEFGIDEDGEQYTIDEPSYEDIFENTSEPEYVHTVSYANGQTIRTILKGEQAALSRGSMIIIDPEGRIFVAGDNEFGQLGVSNENNDEQFPMSVVLQELRGVKGYEVSTGASHTIILGDPVEK